MNHIAITKIVLPKNQNSLCVKSKKAEPSIYIKLNAIILIRFIIKNMAKETNIILVLFKGFIFGTDRLSMSKKEYADPAMQAPTISIGKLFANIKFPNKEVS